MTAAALDALLASRGRVVNVASGLAAVNVPLAAAYSASKRALCAWSDALRLEYAGRLAVAACLERPRRERASTRSTALAMRIARVAPGLVDRVVALRARRIVAGAEWHR